MTLRKLQDSGFTQGSMGWSGSGGLWSYAWSDEMEKARLDELKGRGKIFEEIRDFRDIKPEDLRTRHFLVYWHSKGETTIRQDKEAEGTDLEKLMQKLKP